MCSVKYDKTIARRAIRPDNKIARELPGVVAMLFLTVVTSNNVLSDCNSASFTSAAASQ